MKKLFFSACVLVVGFVFFGCDTGGGGGNNDNKKDDGGSVTVPTELQGNWQYDNGVWIGYLEFTDTTMHFGSIVYSVKDEGHLLTVTSVKSGIIYASDIPIATDYTFTYELSNGNNTIHIISAGNGIYGTIDGTYTKQ